ncbi:MAG: PepSY domain-containing protein [Deltaproteobacteria bacterium]|nr:PepSY domain-containing protein [Deltaproteobacteria bacterium]MBW2394611.1 PepSY domain-containing protein [Deltaproteobacteria bacterium]
MKISKLSRLTHRWGSILIAAPLVVIVVTGVLLQLKKESAWIQPSTQRGSGDEPTLGFDQILAATQAIPEAEVDSWDDIDRLDVRPGKGMLKVRCKNSWEVQLDAATGEVLQVAYRRSDLIESIHDGSFFHDGFKLWVFLPTALILAVLWATGIYLFVLPYHAQWQRRQREGARSQKQRSVGRFLSVSSTTSSD